jgi:hypothetical protein
LHRYGWKRLLLCAVLEFAALTGAPLRPKDIDLVLKQSATVVAQEESEVPEDSPATD